MLRIGLTVGRVAARRLGAFHNRRLVRHCNLNNNNNYKKITVASSFRAFSTCSISDSNASATAITSNVLDAETVNEAYSADASKYGAIEDSSMSDAYSAIELALDSVVKIFTVASSPSYFLPWQNKSQRETMGSGFVISGRRILTNAHVVADHTFVLVRKHGSPAKYRAEVKAVGHECDLSILVVENEEFWEGMNFLELGDVPFLQEAVSVVGYPQGKVAWDTLYI